MKRAGAIGRPKRSSRSLLERELSALWKAHTGDVCQVCPAEGAECSGAVEGHHVVSQEALRRRGVDLIEILWDRRNKLDVCSRRHQQHTTAFKRIPFELLPALAIVFADEFELGWWLERYYP